MHLVITWFHHCRFTSLEPTRPMPISSRESGLFYSFIYFSIRFMMERMYSVMILEVSTADPLNEARRGAASTSFGKVSYYSFCPEILAYYSRIILNSFSYLLFSKLC